MATTAQQAQTGSPSFQYLSDKLAVIIALLNTNHMTANQLQAAAAPFTYLSDKVAVIAYLLTGSGGGGVSGGTTFNNYGGGQPNFIPTGGTGLAVDTSSGTLWEYYNGSWH